MTASQVATNSLAVRHLAERLEHLGYVGDDVVDVAEKLAADLIADGYRRIQPLPALRPDQVATADQRRTHLAHIDNDLAAVRRRISAGAKEEQA